MCRNEDRPFSYVSTSTAVYLASEGPMLEWVLNKSLRYKPTAVSLKVGELWQWKFDSGKRVIIPDFASYLNFIPKPKQFRFFGPCYTSKSSKYLPAPKDHYINNILRPMGLAVGDRIEFAPTNFKPYSDHNSKKGTIKGLFWDDIGKACDVMVFSVSETEGSNLATEHELSGIIESSFRSNQNKEKITLVIDADTLAIPTTVVEKTETSQDETWCVWCWLDKSENENDVEYYPVNENGDYICSDCVNNTKALDLKILAGLQNKVT